jgi:hypothetical protein
LILDKRNCHSKLGRWGAAAPIRRQAYDTNADGKGKAGEALSALEIVDREPPQLDVRRQVNFSTV